MFQDDELRAALDDAASVVVFGDVHGDLTALRTLAEHTAELGLRLLVSVGDLGIGPWGSAPVDRFLKRADQLLEQLDLYLLLTPGNHENHSTIDRALADRRDGLGFGALGHHGRVRVSPRGHRFAVGRRAFGSLGGAVSVDRGFRTPGRSWWPQEVITEAHVAALGDAPLDVLITHDAPAGTPLQPRLQVGIGLAADALEGRRLITQAVEQTRPQVLFCGHWHHRLTHDLPRHDGGVTRVEVLSEEHTVGNSVVLDLDDLAVVPLPVLWRRHLDA
jgi:Icc-related predicted phosphoesterase